MRRQLQDYLEFLRQFRKRFETTGAILPSSRFLAHGITWPLAQRNRLPQTQPVRILEVGPGTGAVTRRIVRLLHPDDRLDLVELNADFVALLEQRFAEDDLFRPAAGQTRIHCCALQKFQSDAPYDFIVSGLPLNNFSSELVAELFDSFFRLLVPDGVLSYFEYMYVRAIRKKAARGAERQRLEGLDAVIRPYLDRYRFRRDWILINVPPAWVQHLRQEDNGSAKLPEAPSSN